jgi:uncharacterized SAM-binding protein YcdF (DUF218 family)
MVLLLTDAFLLLTQVLLWLIVGLVVWFVLAKVLPKAFLGLLVVLLILTLLGLSFIGGPPTDGGILSDLWQIISLPLTPLGLAIILILVLLTAKKLAVVTRRAILLGLVVLALGSLPAVAYFLAQELEMEAIEFVRPFPELTGGARRVIVLLGQGTTYPQLRPPRDTAPPPPEPVQCPPGCNPNAPPPRPERPIAPEAFDILTRLPIQISEKGDRIIYATQLYREETQRGTAPLIVPSAGRRRDRIQKQGETDEEVSEAAAVRTMLTETFGVPASDILIEPNGSNIRRSAERVRDLLNNRVNTGNQLTLVTTAMNMNRAVLTFNQVFDGAIINARPTDFRTLPASSSLSLLVRGRDLVERQIQPSDFLPSARALCLSTEAIEEYLASFYYFLRGWIKPFRPPSVFTPTPVPVFTPSPSPIFTPAVETPTPTPPPVETPTPTPSPPL